MIRRICFLVITVAFLGLAFGCKDKAVQPTGTVTPYTGPTSATGDTEKPPPLPPLPK